jgi:hypothetical protein
MSERSPKPISVQLARSWYADAALSATTGVGASLLSGDVIDNSSGASVVIPIVLFNGGVVATYLSQTLVTDVVLNRIIEQQNPTDTSRKFIADQANKLFYNKYLYGAAGAAAGAAAIVPSPWGIALAAGSVAAFELTEKAMVRIGRRIVKALNRPYDDPKEFAKV